MSYGIPEIVYSSAYTDIATSVAVQLLANGWTKVGATEIYKSAVVDDEGFYSYVRIYDAGGYPGIEVGCDVKDDLSDFRDSITRVSHWVASHWVITVFPLWLVICQVDDISDNYFLAGGLYRPFSRSPYRYHPYFAVGAGSTGADTTNFGNWGGFQEGQRTRTETYQALYCNIGAGIGVVNTAAALTSCHENRSLAGGLVIHPCWVSEPVNLKCYYGELHNVKMVTGMNLDLQNKSSVCAPGTILAINGVQHYVHPRYEIFGDEKGVGVFFQMESFA